MNTTPRFLLLALLAALALAGATGCRTMDFRAAALDSGMAPPPEPPRELAKVSLPAYRIEPPDVIQIEMLKMVPLPPYRLEVYDVLQVRVVGTLVDQPIDGYYLVENEGTIDLGPAYGTLRVFGMTVPEAKTAILEQLQKILNRPDVSVQLARASSMQPVAGTYLVGPDGTINLRQYGTFHVAGRTLTEATEALEKHLSRFFDSPEISLDVVAYNSKVYYIITAGAGLGDNIRRVPVTGNETVLDALSYVGGLSQVSSKDIWIARPAPGGFGCEQILPIDWEAITQGASTATNYQLMPGDRLFVSEDRMVAANNWLSKVANPIERLLGLTGLGANTVRNLETLGRGRSTSNNNALLGF
jgi:polysaccharide biosynthesis/export protein